MPALQDLIHVRPFQPAGVQASPFISQLQRLGVKIHIQPGLRIPLLRRRQIPAGDLQHAHQGRHPGMSGILGLHIGGRLFQGIDPLLRPNVSLFLDHTQRGISIGAPAAHAFLAVAHQHTHHLGRQIQVVPEGEQDFQLLCGENPAQGPLHLPHQQAEFVAVVHGLGHILLGVLGRLVGRTQQGALLRPQAQLPQRGSRAGVPGLSHPQGGLRFLEGVPALQIQMQQHSVPAACTEQLMNFRLG